MQKGRPAARSGERMMCRRSAAPRNVPQELGSNRAGHGGHTRTADAAARLQLRLAVPEDADEAMFHRTLDVIGNEEFRHARRRLWSWEQDLPANVEPREAQLRLEALVEDYNTAVRREIKQTRLKTVFLFVPIGVGMAIDVLVTGGIMHAFATAGTGVIVDRMKTHFPLLTGAAARASHHPAAQLTVCSTSWPQSKRNEILRPVAEYRRSGNALSCRCCGLDSWADAP